MHDVCLMYWVVAWNESHIRTLEIDTCFLASPTVYPLFLEVGHRAADGACYVKVKARYSIHAPNF
jgi:hypothetical protein